MCQSCGNNACGGCQPQIPQGLPGASGKNVYNFTTTSFTMPDADPASPASAADVLITVRSTGQFTNQWAIPGMVVFITGAGWFQVQSITGNNQITVRNLGYTGNATPGATIASGATVSPAGLKGDTGGTGSNGTDGTSSVYSDSTNSSTAALTVTTIKTGPVPANTLVNDGDALEVLIPIVHSNTPVSIFADYIKVQFGGTNIFPASGIFPTNSFLLPNQGGAQFNIRIVKTGATTARVYYIASGLAIGFGTAVGTPVAFYIDLTGLDFTILNNVTLQTVQESASVIVANGLFIDKISA